VTDAGQPPEVVDPEIPGPAATIQRCFDPFYNPLVTGAAGSPAQAVAAARSEEHTSELQSRI